jgi:hypothetical protein
MKRSHIALATLAVAVVGAAGAYAWMHTCCAAPDRVLNSFAEWRSTGPLPDFSTGGRSWDLDSPDDGTNSAFLKVPGDTGPGPILQHPDYPYDRVSTRRMAHTANPILKPEVKAKMDDEVARVLAGGIPFVPTSRCWPGGVPGLHVYTAPNMILQRPDRVTLVNMRGEVRRIYMEVPHSPDPGFTWYGESVGRYENGDTLVVDTVGLEAKGPIDRLNTPHTRELHVVERFTVTPDGQRMRVTMDIVDPGVFTQPFRQMVEYAAITDDWREYVCNENSVEYFIPEEELVPVPKAARRDF